MENKSIIQLKKAISEAFYTAQSISFLPEPFKSVYKRYQAESSQISQINILLSKIEKLDPSMDIEKYKQDVFQEAYEQARPNFEYVIDVLSAEVKRLEQLKEDEKIENRNLTQKLNNYLLKRVYGKL